MSSPLTSITQEHRVERERKLADEVRVKLASRLAGESPLSELVHMILAVMTLWVVWGDVPRTQALGWTGAVIGAAILRGLLRLRAMRGGDPEAAVRPIRAGVVAVSLAWGIGVLFVGMAIPFESLTLIAVMLAGIVAGATLALIADAFSFYAILLGLLLPLTAAIALHDHKLHVVGALLMLIFGTAMVVYFRRSHRALVNQIRTSHNLHVATSEARAAREAGDQLVRIMEATTDHVGIAGPDTKIRYLNRAGRAMLGIGPTEDLSETSIVDLTAPRMRDAVRNQHVPAALRDGAWQGETAFLHRDGREVPVSLVAIVHKNADGSVESMSAIARDVSEEVAARNALKTARDAAEQSTAAKSAFLANTSHEIRTPLNGILGMVELLLDTELTPAQRRSVELIASSGETLLNTINDVLDLSKIEAGQLGFEEISFDVHHVMNSTVRLMMPRASAKKIELVCDVDRALPQYLKGDPHRIRQVLSNLIGNAIKFTETGEVVVSARVVGSGGPDKPRVRISVRDTGIGIAPEDFERIFEPFRQVDVSTTRHYGGTGLGLSIARRIVEMMGGTLQLESAPGRGSDFHFTLQLPVAADDAAPAQRGDASMKGVRVLVVDDHPTNRRILGDMLRWAGSEVEERDGARSALEALVIAAEERHPFRLVVSDVQMPGRDGFQLAEDVRKEPALSDTRIMLLTSAGQRGDGERCRKLGVAAYMQKPVSRVELLEAGIAALGKGDAAGAAGRRSLVTRYSIDEDRPQLRILLAEDNPVNQEVATSLLKKRGHEVQIARDGQEAVQAIRSGAHVDVILMDVQMPKLDGLQATGAIRELGWDGPIVALTANVSSGERERCMAAGMSGYLAKPFRPHELYATVEGWGTRASAGDDGGTASRDGDGSADAIPPVDLETFRAVLADAGIPEAGPQMLKLFLEDTPPHVEALVEAAQRGDLKGVAELAHRVKSGAGNIYATKLSDLLRDAERAASVGDSSAIGGLVRLAKEEHARVFDYLKSEGS